MMGEGSMYKCNQQSSKKCSENDDFSSWKQRLELCFVWFIYLMITQERSIYFVPQRQNQNWDVSFHFFLPHSYFYGSGSHIHFQCNVSVQDNSWLCVGYSLMQISTQPSYLSQPPFLPLLQNGLNLSLRVLVYYLQNSSIFLRYEWFITVTCHGNHNI